MIKPSKFILTSDYTTGINDAKIAKIFTLPDSFTVPKGGDYYLLDEEFDIGKTAAGMRIVLSSSRWDNQYLIDPSNFYVHGVVSAPSFGLYNQNTLISGSITRVGTKVRIQVYAWDEIGADDIRFTDCGQTLTLGVETFISPFDAK